jgi:hypothetical protein
MPNSNTRSIQVGSVDNTLLATVYNTDGSIKADLAHDTTGISIFVQRIGEANGSALTLSAKATPQTAHADGAFLNLGGGDISVDCPDAPFATYKGRARIYGTFTGGTIIGEWFDVVGFDAGSVAVGANTTTPTNLSAAQVRTELATELARIDVAISTRSAFNAASDTVTVGTNNDKTGYALTQAFPANFASLGINSDGHISRVVLVDTTTANTDMRGTDNALLASSYTTPANADIAAIKAKTDNLPNDPATLAKQDEILGAIGDIECGGGGGGTAVVNVLPAIGISADRSPGVTLKAFVGETITQSITLYQTNGVTPIVLTGKTLVIVFETRQGQDVATVPNSGITVGGDDDNVVTFNYPSAATSQERVLKFALRDAGSPNTVYLQGLLSVQRAPKADV